MVPHPAASLLQIRGVVEGFYGPPWSEADTVSVLHFMGSHGMSTFVYAPKDDAFQRAEWNKPYPPDRLEAIARLAQASAADGVTFVYSISPGLTIRYSSDSDRAALLAKLAQLRSVGVHAFMLSLDDIPDHLTSASDRSAYADSLAAAQVDLANTVMQKGAQADAAFTLLLTPTEYSGTVADPYLRTLAQLDPRIRVVWTGPGVVAPTITLEDARAFAAIVGRPPVLWYNYPVNDWTVPPGGTQPRDLFMGPARGLAPDLNQGVAGILANPMIEPQASMVPLASIARYLQDPEGYAGDDGWQAAVTAAGGAQAAALLAFCAGEQPYPTVSAQGRYSWTSTAPAVDARESAVLDAYAHEATAALQGTDAVSLRGTFSAWVRDAPDLTPGRFPNAGLAAEIAPWVRWMGRDGQAGLDALALLGTVPGAGRTAAVTAVRQDMAALRQQPVEFGGDLQAFLTRAVAAAG